MNIRTLDLNHVRALHALLEEAHVGRAARHLGITPAAASNALRRLRTELGDALLVRDGRNLVRTALGTELRGPAREVIASAERLLQASARFEPAAFRGELSVAMADHVAVTLLPGLDRLVRSEAPHALLCVRPVPLDVVASLRDTAGVLVGPEGCVGATVPGDGLVTEPYYIDRYICALRTGHPALRRRWTARNFASLAHVLVTPRGRSARGDVDESLHRLGLTRTVARIVPTFALGIPLVRTSDCAITLPERCAQHLDLQGVTVRPLPFAMPEIVMKLITHAAHASDARIRFLSGLLHAAVRAPDAQ